MNIDHNATTNHRKEFLYGWVSGIYAGSPSDYRQCMDLCSDLEIDCPSFVPPIDDTRQFEESLKQSADVAAMDSFNRGWICGAARGGMPLKDIAGRTGKLSERDIQQIVIQGWGMIWRCGEQPLGDNGGYSEFAFDRPCSGFSEDDLLRTAKEFLEGLCKQRYSFEDMTGYKKPSNTSASSTQMGIDRDRRYSMADTLLKTQTILRDIRCAMANGLDVGMLFTIARIKWVKKRCKECKGRWALGNSTWNVRCIGRRCESTPGAYKCNCYGGGPIRTANSEIAAWSGLYQPIVTDGTIRDATSTPPRQLWDIVTNRVILFGGKVSSLCQWCYDMVSFPCLLSYLNSLVL